MSGLWVVRLPLWWVSVSISTHEMRTCNWFAYACHYWVIPMVHFRSARPPSAHHSFDDSNLSQNKRSFIQASWVLASIYSFILYNGLSRSEAQVEAEVRTDSISTFRVCLKTHKMLTPHTNLNWWNCLLGITENVCAKFQPDCRKKWQNEKQKGDSVAGPLYHYPLAQISLG